MCRKSMEHVYQSKEAFREALMRINKSYRNMKIPQEEPQKPEIKVEGDVIGRYISPNNHDGTVKT